MSISFEGSCFSRKFQPKNMCSTCTPARSLSTGPKEQPHPSPKPIHTKRAGFKIADGRNFDPLNGWGRRPEWQILNCCERKWCKTKQGQLFGWAWKQYSWGNFPILIVHLTNVANQIFSQIEFGTQVNFMRFTNSIGPQQFICRLHKKLR